LEQVGLFQYISTNFAYAFQPYSFVHELRVGLQQSKTELAKRAGELELLDMVEFHIGFVELPSLPYYGVPGGRTLSYDVDVVAPLDSTELRLGLQHNTPDLLAVFPYAYDATSLMIKFAGSLEDFQ
jgi:hypothetical protein